MTYYKRINRRQFITGTLKGCSVFLAGSWLLSTSDVHAGELIHNGFEVDRDDVFRMLKIAGRNGCDFAEIFLEKRLKRSFQLKNGTPGDINSLTSEGTAIRTMNGLSVNHISVEGFRKDRIKQAVKQISESCNKTGKKNKPRKLPDHPERRFGIIMQKIPFNKIPESHRLHIAQIAHYAAKQSSNLVDHVLIHYEEELRHILIANSRGLFRIDEQPLITLSIQVTVSNKKRTYTGSRHLSSRKGFEAFQVDVLEKKAIQAVEESVQMLSAVPTPTGTLPVVLGKGSGGQLLHDTLGILLRADTFDTKSYCCRDLFNRQVAHKDLNIVDNGACVWAPGSTHFDDEGTATGRTELIKNGVLKCLLTDINSAKRLKMPLTGNCRRSIYRNPPSVETTNFYVETGDNSVTDIFDQIPSGLYCKSFSNISFDPASGNFTAFVKEAYHIRNRKPGAAVEGAILSGNILDMLWNIDQVGDELELTHEFKENSEGKAPSLPYSFGQPYIKIRSIKIES